MMQTTLVIIVSQHWIEEPLYKMSKVINNTVASVLGFWLIVMKIEVLRIALLPTVQ